MVTRLTDSLEQPRGHAQEINDEDRPVKKQKISNGSVADPNIIKLSVAPDGHHVVAITDDKMLRILRINPDGTLEELSQRCMPKRPCAIDVLPDNTTVLCGDKFGDVYSLPLHPGNYEVAEHASESQDAQKPTDGNFKPTASNLTVHTKRNLRALEAQMSQKLFTARKEPLAFEHQFLLGHVSMLTDMKHANHVVGSKRRSYIITADRDEHIRVSRGPPHSYVTEGYCLGHQEFVSKICLVPDTELLVSGGGDDWLGVWDWVQFKLLHKVDLRPLVGRSGCSNASEFPIAVSGIWFGRTPDKVVAVAVEKLPVLFVIPVSSLRGDGSKRFVGQTGISIISLDANPIDLMWVENTMVVSQDVRDETHQRLVAFRFDPPSAIASTDNPFGAQRLRKDDSTARVLGILDDFIDEGFTSDKSLDDLLYSVNHLRKRRDAGADAEDGENVDIVDD